MKVAIRTAITEATARTSLQAYESTDVNELKTRLRYISRQNIKFELALGRKRLKHSAEIPTEGSYLTVSRRTGATSKKVLRLFDDGVLTATIIYQVVDTERKLNAQIDDCNS